MVFKKRFCFFFPTLALDQLVQNRNERICNVSISELFVFWSYCISRVDWMKPANADRSHMETRHTRTGNAHKLLAQMVRFAHSFSKITVCTRVFVTPWHPLSHGWSVFFYPWSFFYKKGLTFVAASSWMSWWGLIISLGKVCGELFKAYLLLVFFKGKLVQDFSVNTVLSSSWG